MALVNSIKGNGIEVKLMLPLITSTVSKLNLKEYQRKSIEYHRRPYLSCIDKPRKMFLKLL